MKLRFRFTFAMIISLVLCVGAFAADDEGWIPLFNGKNLDGWTPKIKGYDLGDNFGNTFYVEDGVIKVTYEKYDKFDKRYGHLFFKEPFSSYKFRLEYRFVGEQCNGGEGWALRNSGIMLHCQDPATMTKDQDFPDSIEVQLLGGNGKDDRSTANLCTPGTQVVMDGKLIKQHCTNSASETYHGEQWVTCEVEVHGSGKIIHKVNGEKVMEYEKSQKDDGTLIEGGYISVQSESHPCEFRNIEILPLDK
ncbi:MAG: DUF1080 domain-containing protein [Candidatus Hinthialibacter antarcticus]|nr:DUF1080 domain-containing protein [Candidatus Hinthialibacter antarcticus]